MFQVVHKDHNTFATGFLTNWETVYDVKKNFETNEIMFLFYDRDSSSWEYRSADGYEPIGQTKGVFL